MVFLTIKDTLLELTTKHFSSIKKSETKKKIIKIPRLKSRFNQAAFSLSTLLISSSIKEVKEEKKKKNLEQDLKEDEITIVEDKEVVVGGGYGTIRVSYGGSPNAKNVDYDKLFSHLGSFRAKGMYEDFGGGNADVRVNNTSEGTREMVSMETVDKAARFFKYAFTGEIPGDMGLVPPVGIGVNSKDWEKYRVMSQMSIYKPLIKLKMSTA